MLETIQLKLLAVIDDVISLTSDDFRKTEHFCLHQYTKFKLSYPHLKETFLPNL